GAMSPDPDTVSVSPACRKPCAEADSALPSGPAPRALPAHRPPGQAPCRFTWSKTAVARAGPPVDDEPPSELDVTVYPGEAANSPARDTAGNPGSVARPTSDQCMPSAES